MKPQAIISIYEHGVLITGSDGRGLPVDILGLRYIKSMLKAFPIMDTIVAMHKNVPVAITTKSHMAAFREEMGIIRYKDIQKDGSINDRLRLWLHCDQMGSTANALALFAMNRPITELDRYDPFPFGNGARSVAKLLALVPEIVDCFGSMGRAYPAWKPYLRVLETHKAGDNPDTLEADIAKASATERAICAWPDQKEEN